MRGRGALVLVALLAACASTAPAQRPPAADAGAIDLLPRVAARPIGGDPIWIPRLPSAARTRALVDLALHETPGGPGELSYGQAPIVIGQDLVVLGDPVSVEGTDWLRVYVVPLQGGSGDVFTWIPAKQDGRDTVSPPRVDDCPSTRDNLSTIAALDPFTRTRCLGAATFTVEGSTWPSLLPIPYEVEPAWLGPWLTGAPSPSLVTSPPGPMTVRVPPGLEAPPPDITIRAELHVADPATSSCTRTATPNMDVPAESSTDSRAWCVVQVVIDRWVPLLGPEGRPFDAAAPQLHRFTPYGVCAGTGMGTLTFHTDPTRLDPVWLERGAGDPPVVARFGPEFHTAFMPGLVVVDDAGRVVARDGLVIDADTDLAGHFLCGSGNWLDVF